MHGYLLTPPNNVVYYNIASKTNHSDFNKVALPPCGGGGGTRSLGDVVEEGSSRQLVRLRNSCFAKTVLDESYKD